jgi:hypothetical protein
VFKGDGFALLCSKLAKTEKTARSATFGSPFFVLRDGEDARLNAVQKI